MGKFKVGDRVRNIEGNMAAKIGAMATVTAKAEYWCDICRATLVDVIWDDDEMRCGQSHGGYYLSSFELASANDNDNTSPVRTVTRREIVPGVYGFVEVGKWAAGQYVKFYVAYPTAEQLRSAARIFNEIADVLDEQSAEAKKDAA